MVNNSETLKLINGTKSFNSYQWDSTFVKWNNPENCFLIIPICQTQNKCTHTQTPSRRWKATMKSYYQSQHVARFHNQINSETRTFQTWKSGKKGAEWEILKWNKNKSSIVNSYLDNTNGKQKKNLMFSNSNIHLFAGKETSQSCDGPNRIFPHFQVYKCKINSTN